MSTDQRQIKYRVTQGPGEMELMMMFFSRGHYTGKMVNFTMVTDEYPLTHTESVEIVALNWWSRGEDNWSWWRFEGIIKREGVLDAPRITGTYSHHERKGEVMIDWRGTPPYKL